MAISLAFTVDNISTVIQIYNTIEVQRADTELPTDLTNYATLSGVAGHPIYLVGGTTQYTLWDPVGTARDWYRSRYYNTSTGAFSAWSDPVLGEAGDLFYNPLFPPEIAYGSSDQAIIDKLRVLIGDPLSLRREYGEEAASSIHSDNKTYELDTKGWPVSVTMAGRPMNDSTDPTVNGYKYLRFDQDISVTVISGCIEYGVDIWYYSFRHSDRAIMEAYDSAFIPIGLTETTVTIEAYMLQASLDLLYQEGFENSIEDGANVFDEGSKYDPTPGFNLFEELLKRRRRELDELVRQLRMYVGGVRID